MNTVPPRMASVAMATVSFALPALALTLPSGYSLPALVLCVLGIWAWTQKSVHISDKRTLLGFAMALTGLCVLWTWDAMVSQPFKVNGLDRPVKFALAWLVLPALVWLPPPARMLQWGIWVGAMGAAATAYWQVQVIGMDRAWGHTNAIQFGNLALLMGIWSAVWSVHAKGREKWLAWVAVAAGLYATVASESRGGWWVSVLLLPAAWWMARRTFDAATIEARNTSKQIASRWAATVTLLLALGAIGTQAPRLIDRTQQALQEVQLHLTTGESTNSVGQRLAHWHLAWQMGWDKPLTGWGEQGYQQEKAQRVAAGQAPQVLLAFHHAHNEWLDMWAKHGLLGLLCLFAVYAVPATIYGRVLATRRLQPGSPTTCKPIQLASAACGLLMVIGYVGFGMTQVMFAHNSSSIMYVFMNLLWMGAVLGTVADGPTKKKPPEPES